MTRPNRVERTVTSGPDGREYYRMIIPAGWEISAHKNLNIYNGYGVPFAVSIRMASPDQVSGAMYHSTLFFTDDFLKEYPENSVDEFGVLHRTYEGPDVLVAARGDMAFGSMEGLEVLETVRDPAYEAIRARREEEIRAAEKEDPLTVIEKVTYEHVRRVYSFVLNGIPYRGCFAATVEAVRCAKWRPVSVDIAAGMDDPSSSAFLEQVYPNLHYDEYRREYLYTAKHGVDVHLYGQFACWAPEEIYDDMYLTVFNPMIRGGAVICDDLREELRVSQEVIDRRNRAIREETRRIAEDNRETLQVNLEKGKALRDELQKTADTIRIAWLNQNNHTPKR